jgi:leader peptidase (prepilin peptidase)/N-methyltransferase
MSIFEIAVFLFTGSIAAILSNIVIFRLPGFRNIFKLKNFCKYCKNNYKFFDYLPLFVFIFRNGRCRYCNKRLPLSKLFSDILLIAASFILGSVFDISYQYFAYIVLFTILTAIVFIDIESRTIPDVLTIAALFFGFLLMFLNSVFKLNIFPMYNDWWKPLLGIIPGTGFLLLIALAGILITGNDNILGMGDVKIFAPVGLFLGFERCIVAVMLSFIAGGVFSFILLILGQAKKKMTIPFAPFIVLATFITIIEGENIIKYIANLL